jgi:UDP-N-acetylmuramyl pentapeptide synthase
MLELGDFGAGLHGDLAQPVDEAQVDVLYAAGPLMANLWARTPAARRGAYAETSEGLRDALLSGLRAGDVVMIKGSLGSRMGPLAEAIGALFAPLNKDA